MAAYTIGLDFGTNSVRALLVNTATGEEIATAIFDYRHGNSGVILDPKDPNLARQHPQDYLDGAEISIRQLLADGQAQGVTPDQIIGIGVDTTGSTPIPIDAQGTPLAFAPQFHDNPAALAWLWKDHTSHAEAEEITSLAQKIRPAYLAKCGGRYSSEWFWAKLLHCARTAPAIFEAAATWVEFADFLPAALCGTTAPHLIRRGICAAGHKAFYHEAWGGYPDETFLQTLDPRLARIRQSLPNKIYSIADPAGTLSAEWATKLNLRPGIPVAVGAFDVHLGAVGSGIQSGVLCKIMGTSTCDLMIASLDQPLADIPGLCGIVPDSILPGFYGMEAGQSAVGDILLIWFVQIHLPRRQRSRLPRSSPHPKSRPLKTRLESDASLSLDWHNGNRTVPVDRPISAHRPDPHGLTLHTTPAEIYTPLIEAYTAFEAPASSWKPLRRILGKSRRHPA